MTIENQMTINADAEDLTHESSWNEQFLMHFVVIFIGGVIIIE